MSISPDRRYRISEVSELTEVPIHVLRQWEAKIPQLKPKRDRANRRYYTARDLEVVKRIKYMVRHEKMSLEGAKIRIAQELHGTGRPRTNSDVIDLLDKIEDEVRAMQNLLDSAI